MFLRGQVIISEAGRDKDYLMAVTDYDGTYVYVCDGKERRLSQPKRKNPKHITMTQWFLTEDQLHSDRRLRKALGELEYNNE
ncbi:MAG: KOW domain-containing RNA-binding protein [Clostridia bacterium]|nr:KOW domain-containing RNA-binding protein [Clostridia bacterium]